MGKTKVQKIGFLVGIVAMLVIGFMPTPEGLSLVGQRVLAVTVLMVVFWITEAMPIPFTALLPIFLFPVMCLDEGYTFLNTRIALFCGIHLLRPQNTTDLFCPCLHKFFCRSPSTVFVIS